MGVKAVTSLVLPHGLVILNSKREEVKSGRTSGGSTSGAAPEDGTG